MSKKDSFDEMTEKELIVNFRRNLEKAKELANAANNRSRDAARDVVNVENALIKYLDLYDKRVVELTWAINELHKFLALPWYKKLFYKKGK